MQIVGILKWIHNFWTISLYLHEICIQFFFDFISSNHVHLSYSQHTHTHAHLKIITNWTSECRHHKRSKPPTARTIKNHASAWNPNQSILTIQMRLPSVCCEIWILTSELFTTWLSFPFPLSSLFFFGMHQHVHLAWTVHISIVHTSVALRLIFFFCSHAETFFQQHTPYYIQHWPNSVCVHVARFVFTQSRCCWFFAF